MTSAPPGGGSREESPQGHFGAFAQAAAGADLILIDTQLPVLGGYDATHQIKSGRNLKEQPINAVSSLAMKGDEEKARAARCELRDTYSPVQLLPIIAGFRGKK